MLRLNVSTKNKIYLHLDFLYPKTILLDCRQFNRECFADLYHHE